MLGRNFINTCDTEIVKAILATNFKDFGLGTRQLSFGPLLGRGIFTTDGAQWEHSRVSLFVGYTISKHSPYILHSMYDNLILSPILT